MKRILVLLMVFVTIILNGIVFDVLQPSHGHGDDHGHSAGGEQHVSSSNDQHGDSESNHNPSTKESHGSSHGE